MWPFRKKPAASVAQVDPSVAAIRELKAWRPIGGTFRYLGREMVVTGHSEVRFYGIYCIHTVPLIRADYADERGVIHNLTFNLAEARALMATQP